MFDRSKITTRQTKPLDTRQLGGPNFANVDVGNFNAGPDDNLSAVPPVYRGANNIVACEFLYPTQTVTWTNIWHHNVGRLGGEHFDSVYIRNQKIGQTIVVRDCLADYIAGGFVLMEAGCAGTLQLYDNECRNVGYPRPVTIKPTSAANRITLYMAGNVRCHVQIDKSKLVAGQKLSDCLKVHLGTNPESLMPNWAALGIVPTVIGTPATPVDVHIDCNKRIAELESSLRLSNTTRENTERALNAMKIERDALIAKIVKIQEIVR
jgi:hypothetical protein